MKNNVHNPAISCLTIGLIMALLMINLSAVTSANPNSSAGKMNYGVQDIKESDNTITSQYRNMIFTKKIISAS